jgi:hypothetical protein
VSEEQRRIPHVRELAVAGDFALIGGFSAFFVGKILSGYPGGLERLLARSGLPAERRNDVLRAVGALVHAGAKWRVEGEAGSGSASGSGTVPSAFAAPCAPSRRAVPFEAHRIGEASPAAREASPFLGSAEVASVLGISPRMVRRLASSGALPGQRDAGGRWLFAAVDVAAERARRMSQAGARDVA